MSTVSAKAYRNNFFNKEFLRYYFNITPQKLLEQLSIGSRPSKRNKSKDVKSLRAIPGFLLGRKFAFFCQHG